MPEKQELRSGVTRSMTIWGMDLSELSGVLLAKKWLSKLVVRRMRVTAKYAC